MLKRLRNQLRKAALSFVASRGRENLFYPASWLKEGREEAIQLQAELHRQTRDRLAERNREPWFEVYKRHSGRQLISSNRRRSPRERVQPLQKNTASVPSSSPPISPAPVASPIEQWRQQQHLYQQRQQKQELPKVSQHQTQKPTAPATEKRTANQTLVMHPLQRARVISALTKREQHRYRQRRLLLDELDV
ncbi:uncharacterized protein LOC108109653 [Drosophila eugracilis]|uniref:uncharacterized protein LOC108109653 n=1 Tax=Drosophila eugracilis TaxID=29029 RepID=UPI0007E63D82|nr:uncharacterized protein LOC108109653 [Drosophila eugracilis]